MRGNREVESVRGRNSLGRESADEPDAKQVEVLRDQDRDEVWEPGAGAEATGGLCPGLNRTGVACRPSRPPHDAGESETKQRRQTHVRADGLARGKATMAEAVKAAEIIAEPEAIKGPGAIPVTRKSVRPVSGDGRPGGSGRLEVQG